MVIPPEKIALHMPAVAVDIVLGPEEGKRLADAADVSLSQIQLKLGEEGQHALPDRAELVSEAVEYFQAVSPGKLSLDDVNRISRLVINVIAVKP